ncbi:MAG: hypothetical protein VX667_05665 [Nitrospinota bacterium]|nr:hypothetical protein [Nitrospinota bacterium]
MDTEEASWIVSELAQGNTWQFQWTVAQEQANVARSYLSSLGFGLELIHADAPLAPSESPPLQDTGQIRKMEETGKRKSWLSSLFSRNKGETAVKDKISGTPAPEEQPKGKSLFGFLKKK